MMPVAGQPLTLQGRVAVVGVGNPRRGDDAAGVIVARLLRRLGAGRSVAAPGGTATLAGVIEAGPVPEAYAGEIAALAPDTILLVDAVDLGAAPGALAFLTPADLLDGPAWESHRLPLALFARYLSLRTGAAVCLAGVGAGATEWGARPARCVRLGAHALVRLLREHLS